MTAKTNHYYKTINVLNEKLPTELVRVVFSFGILNEEQRLQFLINRLRTYEYKGDKRKFGNYIRRAFDGKKWRRYGLTYLVKGRQPTRTITYNNGETETQKIDSKYNEIKDIIARLCETRNTDLLPFMIELEKYMIDNRFIKKN
jgi:hypothetical protein